MKVIIFLTTALILSCKPKSSDSDMNPNKSTGSTAATAQQSAQSNKAQTLESEPSDVNIHLFDDEERIYTYPAALQTEEDGKALPVPLVALMAGQMFERVGSDAIHHALIAGQIEESDLALTALPKKIIKGVEPKPKPKTAPPTKMEMPEIQSSGSFSSKESSERELREAAYVNRKWKGFYRYIVEPISVVNNFLKNPAFSWEASKMSYFTTRIQKKYDDFSYNKYSVIPKIESTEIDVFKGIDIPQGTVILGMLPTTGILKDSRFDMHSKIYKKHPDFPRYEELEVDLNNLKKDLKEAKNEDSLYNPKELEGDILRLEELRVKLRDKIVLSNKNEGDFRTIDVFSIVEDFELKHIKEYARSNSSSDITEITLTPNLTKISNFSKGRYKVEVDLDDAEKVTLGLNRWNQYSTPDRTMMTSAVLKSAAFDLSQSIKKGHHAYIHCKSGISRSATTLATARSILLIDAAVAKGLIPSKADISGLFDEQIKMIQRGRPEVEIKGPQRANAESVLFDYAAL